MRNVISALSVLLLVSGCGTLQIERLEPRAQTDLSGVWNDTDARQVAGMVARELQGASLDSSREQPVVIIGMFRNLGTEAVSLSAVERWVETELVRSGRFRVVASADLRSELRSERVSQQEWASAETRTALRKETGAEFMLQGTLHTWEESDRRTTVRTFRVDTYLVHLESTERVWAGSHEIKKEIRTRWIGF